MEQRDLEIQVSIADEAMAEWRITAFGVKERVDRGYRASVEVVSLVPVDADALIGEEASVFLSSPQGLERSFRGVLTGVRQRAISTDRFGIVLEVSTKIELLKLGSNSKIFQDQSVVDVVTEVLDAAEAGEQRWETNGTYEPHVNIVQYQESDFDFVARLLEEEGIRFVIDDSADGQVIRFFDDDTGLSPVEGEAILNDRRSDATGIDTVATPRQRIAAAPDQVVVRDYDFRQPATDLTTRAEAPDSGAREVYLHPGEFVDTGRGQRLADRALERVRADTWSVEAETTAPRLAPGRTFVLNGSNRLELNDEYQVLEVEHVYTWSETDAHYFNRVRLAPKVLAQRPRGAASAPRILGPQPAFVTVPGGEEIHTDEHGRSKVRFPWDRSGVTDDKSSTWLRVGQLALGGSMVLPRQDFEVLVDTELGDLDRPCILGHLYNDEKPPPYALPGGKTRSSMQSGSTGGAAGANEVRFEDAGGGEEIFINASKDITVNTANDASWQTDVDETVSIGANSVMSVVGNHNVNVAGDRSLDVGANLSLDVGGDVSDGVGGSLTVDIGGARMVQTGGDHPERIGGSLTRTVSALQSVTGIAGYDRTIAGDSTTSVGAVWGEIAGGSRMLDVKGSYTETVGALKMIKAKGVAVSCGAAYIVNAAAVKEKIGGSRTDGAKGAVALTSAGVTSIQAKNITISGSNRIVIRGGACTITLKKSGMVEVSAPTIVVKNAKNLSQVIHKSN